MAFVRNICFTINNYTLSDIGDCEILVERCKYMIMGFEIGDNGTPHIQGYAELNSKMRYKGISKILKRAHIEIRKGSQKEANEYCKKEGNFITFGKLKKQGERNDIDVFKRLALDGGLRAVTDNTRSQQVIRVAEIYLTYHEEPRDWKPFVTWLWGPSGAGKSKLARKMCGDDVYIKNAREKWWPGYDQHEYVIIDDFRDNWWPIEVILGLLDRYEYRVETKGGYRQFVPKEIYITSIFHPEGLYKGTGEDIYQLLRRIDVIDYVEKVVPEVVVPEVKVGNSRATFTCDLDNILEYM